MAMQKKKAKAIEVDERRYLWCANLRGAVGDLTITCQHETGQGALLLVKAQHTDHWYRISVETGTPGKSVALPPNEIDFATPSFVRSAILFGLSVGWNPLVNGKPLVLRYHDGTFLLE